MHASISKRAISMTTESNDSHLRRKDWVRRGEYGSIHIVQEHQQF